METLCQDLQRPASLPRRPAGAAGPAGMRLSLRRGNAGRGWGQWAQGGRPGGCRDPQTGGAVLSETRSRTQSIRRGQGVGACFQASTRLCSPAEASSSGAAHSANCLKQAMEVEPRSQHCLPAPGNTWGRNTHACRTRPETTHAPAPEDAGALIVSTIVVKGRVSAQRRPPWTSLKGR